ARATARCYMLNLSPVVVLLPAGSSLSPYTTLFRSHRRRRSAGGRVDRRHHRRPVALSAPPHRGPARRRRGQRTRRRCPGRREARSEEHTSELQSRENLVCRLLLEKKNKANRRTAQR